MISALISHLLSSGMVPEKVRSNLTNIILALPPDVVDDIGLAYYLTTVQSTDQKRSWEFARWAVDRLNQPEFDVSEVSIDRDALGIDLAVYCLATSETLENTTSRLVKTSNGSVSNLETLAFVVGLSSRLLLRLARSVPEDCYKAAEKKVVSAKEECERANVRETNMQAEKARLGARIKELEEERDKLQADLDFFYYNKKG